MALAFAEFAELSKCMGIGDVLAVPRQEIIYFPDDRHGNMQSVPDFTLRDVTSDEIALREVGTMLIDGKCRKIARVMEPLGRMC